MENASSPIYSSLHPSGEQQQSESSVAGEDEEACHHHVLAVKGGINPKEGQRNLIWKS